MVCRHCPRPPWRPAPIAFLLPPLLLSLALATTHRPHTNTTPPTLSYTPPPPTTQATEHHAHQHTHIHYHQHFLAFAAARTAPEDREDEKQCATVPPLDEKSIPKEELEAKCQTCSRDNEACVQGREPCPPLTEELCATEEEEKREELIRKRTLRHCPHLVLYSVMCEEQVESIRNRTLAGCSTVARHLQEMDNMVGRVLQQHKAIITTYNCERSYSIRQTCTECQVSSHSPLELCRSTHDIPLGLTVLK
ncbi:uncharacterized protein [Panulirus ornatus]|uniref:uncharacterized protein n=1 Tax=Panulirus ornatus TaxID=150431 RepID=UPI003A8A84BE